MTNVQLGIIGIILIVTVVLAFAISELKYSEYEDRLLRVEQWMKMDIYAR